MLILACLVDILLHRTGIGLPGWSDDTLALLGSAALPLGLLWVGVALQLHHIRNTSRELIGASVLRFGVMPILMLLALQWLDMQTLVGSVLIAAWLLLTPGLTLP